MIHHRDTEDTEKNFLMVSYQSEDTEDGGRRVGWGWVEFEGFAEAY